MKPRLSIFPFGNEIPLGAELLTNWLWIPPRDMWGVRINNKFVGVVYGYNMAFEVGVRILKYSRVSKLTMQLAFTQIYQDRLDKETKGKWGI